MNVSMYVSEDEDESEESSKTPSEVSGCDFIYVTWMRISRFPPRGFPGRTRGHGRGGVRGCIAGVQGVRGHTDVRRASVRGGRAAAMGLCVQHPEQTTWKKVTEVPVDTPVVDDFSFSQVEYVKNGCQRYPLHFFQLDLKNLDI